MSSPSVVRVGMLCAVEVFVELVVVFMLVVFVVSSNSCGTDSVNPDKLAGVR